MPIIWRRVRCLSWSSSLYMAGAPTLHFSNTGAESVIINAVFAALEHLINVAVIHAAQRLRRAFLRARLRLCWRMLGFPILLRGS